MNSDTPRTDEQAATNTHRYGVTMGRFVRADFARQLERELNEAKKWKEEDPRMLREQIRVSDIAFNYLVEDHKKLHADRDQWKAMAQELAAKLEAAAHTFRMRFASSVDTLKTTPTPYDESLSRFNAMNKCHHGIRDTATNLPYCRKCDEEGLK